MSQALRTVITAGAVAAVCASSIVGGGALAASADPVSPTVKGSQTSISFVVPEPGSYHRDSAPVSGGANFAPWPGATKDDFSILIGCDNGVTYTVSKEVDGPYSVPTSVFFRAALPLELVGHSCTLSMTASNGVPIWIQPANVGNDKGKTATYFQATLVYRSRLGGL